YVSHEMNADGEVTVVHCNYIEKSKSGEENAGIKVKGVVQWVNAEDAVDVTLNKYGGLLLDEEDGVKDFDKRLNPNSLVVVKGAKAEPFLKKEEGKSFQFMRMGYYKVAKTSENETLCYLIVDLKDSFNKK
ncbi:MAG: glutamine--tRNA ligase, partial [Clostridia bacterium]|nr:glutamine--tRNA ligase [Clostridia bacterium]